jgi:chemotaxis methyl-accepting protein methylase
MLNDNELKVFLSRLQEIHGVDLSSYRESFLRRRISFRMQLVEAKDYSTYLDILKKDPAEYKRFIDNFSINVTEFFRDTDVFECFKNNCVRELLRRKAAAGHKVIRAWSMGCASGEEAYSLAITIKEELKDKTDDFLVSIWGTDIDRDALDTAGKAEYSSRSLKGMDLSLRQEYFDPIATTQEKPEDKAACAKFVNGVEQQYRLKDTIKKLVHFKQHNFINDPPLRFMDFVFCRNVMIYLDRQEIEVMITKFHKALTTMGYLVIGKTEGIRAGNLGTLFLPVDLNKKIFQKRR